MTTISHEAKSDRPWTRIVVRETWVSLAISVIWLSVLFDAIYGPNILTSSSGGSPQRGRPVRGRRVVFCVPRDLGRCQVRPARQARLTRAR